MSAEEDKAEASKPLLLTDEEIEKYAQMDYEAKRSFSIYGELETKFANTIKSLEDDLKSVEGLHRFIKTGVLVTDQIILSAEGDSSYAHRLGMMLRVLGNTEGSITVDLSLEDAQRLLKMLPALIEAAKKVQQLSQLKALYSEKHTSRRW